MSTIKVNRILTNTGGEGVDADIIGNLTGNVTGNVTGTATTATTATTAEGLTATANVSTSGIITASNFDGDVTGTLDSTFARNIGICTNSVQTQQLTGVGNSFFGMYIGDGFIGFNPRLAQPGGYYIASNINALNAGPVSLASTMQLDGVWVIV